MSDTNKQYTIVINRIVVQLPYLICQILNLIPISSVIFIQLLNSTTLRQSVHDDPNPLTFRRSYKPNCNKLISSHRSPYRTQRSLPNSSCWYDSMLRVYIQCQLNEDT